MIMFGKVILDKEHTAKSIKSPLSKVKGLPSNWFH